jgi:hypothetical protein
VTSDDRHDLQSSGRIGLVDSPERLTGTLDCQGEASAISLNNLTVAVPIVNRTVVAGHTGGPAPWW